ncbi:hypothetical protein PAAG_00145 [Paracoccidioides lutzii Pb01]|uniref:DUF6590 domain-containing protein n=1 Tax=Paracoccidioides lutzii (strain ATCC MYA-826 / Pb01) TaxID=502779 RepID=C1GNQ0_PARBA|nr:hypothetical protein PAAG_00145 [Paracoccidioides lutzii Pb01]EEH35822.2 hypothetical protein PAAG_00145 [Paracoccidioides lutzii Pb01]
MAARTVFQFDNDHRPGLLRMGQARWLTKYAGRITSGIHSRKLREIGRNYQHLQGQFGNTARNVRITDLLLDRFLSRRCHRTVTKQAGTGNCKRRDTDEAWDTCSTIDEIETLTMMPPAGIKQSSGKGHFYLTNSPVIRHICFRGQAYTGSHQSKKDQHKHAFLVHFQLNEIAEPQCRLAYLWVALFLLHLEIWVEKEAPENCRMFLELKNKHICLHPPPPFYRIPSCITKFRRAGRLKIMSRRRDQPVEYEEQKEESGREPWASRQGGPLLAGQVGRGSDALHFAIQSPNVPRTLTTSHNAYAVHDHAERTRYHDVVESTRGLNLNTHDTRQVGTCSRESKRIENPHQNVRYHLSSTPHNPLLQAASPYPPDVTRYDRGPSNPQPGYYSEYPIHPEDSYSFPPAFSGLLYPDNHPPGYHNPWLQYPNAHRSSPYVPTWGTQYYDPITHVSTFQGHGRNAAPSWSKTEEGLDPGWKIGPTDAGVSLGESFCVREGPRRYFKTGQIFSLLWHEPAGKRGTTLTLHNEHVYSKIRRMVVVAEKKDCCWCLAIRTYGGRGINKTSLDHRAHAIIRMRDGPREDLNSKTSTMIQDEFIVVPEEGETLMGASLLDFGKVYTVEHNVKVKSIGKLTNGCISLLLKNWKRHSISKSSRHSYSASR